MDKNVAWWLLSLRYIDQRNSCFSIIVGDVIKCTQEWLFSEKTLQNQKRY